MRKRPEVYALFMVHPNPSPDPEATLQAARDQFISHVKNVYLTDTGQPWGTRAAQGMRSFARVLDAMGQGELQHHGPQTALNAMIGACQIVMKEFGE